MEPEHTSHFCPWKEGANKELPFADNPNSIQGGTFQGLYYKDYQYLFYSTVGGKKKEKEKRYVYAVQVLVCFIDIHASNH